MCKLKLSSSPTVVAIGQETLPLGSLAVAVFAKPNTIEVATKWLWFWWRNELFCIHDFRAGVAIGQETLPLGSVVVAVLAEPNTVEVTTKGLWFGNGGCEKLSISHLSCSYRRRMSSIERSCLAQRTTVISHFQKDLIKIFFQFLFIIIINKN